MNLVLVTGNANKAKQYELILGSPIEAVALDIDEIQSLDLKIILEAKARAAYSELKRPLIVDDVSYEIQELKGLPGPLVKWFVETIGPEGLCRLADQTKDRKVVARVGIGYCDQNGFQSFIGEASGVVPQHAAGTGGFGWDAAMIQDGWEVTHAELSDEEYHKASIRKIALDALKTYLTSHNAQV